MAFRFALFLAMLSSYVGVIVNFVTLAVISRLLSPYEVGLFVLGNAVVVLSTSLREFAPCHYLIQRPVLVNDDIRGGITVMAVVNCAIAGGLVLGAPLVAAAYGEPDFTLFLTIAAASIVLDSVPHPIVALLCRDMAFGRLAVFNIFNSIFYLLTAISLVYLGFGFVGLAWAWLITSVANSVLALALRPGLHIFKPSGANWRDVSAYGGRNGTVNTLLQVFEQLPYLLLGRFHSAPIVAGYNRAFLISRLPDRIIVNGTLQVILAAVSKRFRDGETLDEPYLRGIQILTGIQWPALALIGLLATPVIHLLLGHQWTGSAPMLQLLVVAAMFSFAFPVNLRVMAAIGAMHEMFRCALAVLPLSILIVSLATLSGVKALAISLIFVLPLQAFATFYCVKKQMGWAWGELLTALGKSAVVTGCSVIGATIVLAINGFDANISYVMAALAAFMALAGWFLGLRLTQHAILYEVQRTHRQLHAWVKASPCPAD